MMPNHKNGCTKTINQIEVSNTKFESDTAGSG